jgi:uncharacterized phage-like protein YoqJ
MLKVVVVTGYKAHELGIFDPKHEGVKIIKKVLNKRLTELIEQGLQWVLISGQTGVELWAAECVIKLKEEYKDIKLGVLTPFLNQENKWKTETQDIYKEILAQADYVDAISKKEYENPGQLKAKNQFLINKSDGLLVLYDEDKEGSPIYYLNEANKKKKGGSYEILFITPMDIQFAAEEDMEEDPNYWAQ